MMGRHAIVLVAAVLALPLNFFAFVLFEDGFRVLVTGR